MFLQYTVLAHLFSRGKNEQVSGLNQTYSSGKLKKHYFCVHNYCAIFHYGPKSVA